MTQLTQLNSIISLYSLPDIDECVNETICGEHGFCENTDGSYRCQCYRGYANAPDGQGCVGMLLLGLFSNKIQSEN